MMVSTFAVERIQRVVDPQVRPVTVEWNADRFTSVAGKRLI
jgi:hypothetical protein